MNKSLSLKSANVLFLLTMLLVITFGSLVQAWNLSAGLIATELFLILLPALLFLRARHIPLKDGLRLNPISPLTAVLCLALGIATFLFSAIIEGIMAQVTGMQTVPITESSLPTGIFDSILYFLALAVFAPLGEETLFRGTIQGAYQSRHSTLFAILITATMFAFYHFRVSGLPGLIPIALILSYVAWRTNSLYASMLIHLGINATSAANTLAYLQGSPAGLGIVSLWTALGGLVTTIVILLVIRKLHPLPAQTADEAIPTGEPIPAEKSSSWFGTYWPLIGAGALYLAVAILTVYASTLGIGTTKDLSYFPPKIERPIESTYQITNRAGDVVGEMTCRLTPQNETFSLSCEDSIQAYEISLGNSYYKDNQHSTRWSASWDATSLNLLAYQFENESNDGNGYQAGLENGRLTVASQGESDTLEVSEPYLMDYEWAWRTAALQANNGDTFKAPFVRLLSYDDQLKRSVPTIDDETLKVGAFETLDLPAGTYDAREINLGSQAAWFAVPDDNIPRLVKFDDGMVTYSLMKN